MPLIRYHFNTIDSTNSWAKENSSLFPEEGITLVTAEKQTKGRGRFTASWDSPAGYNIYASFCFFVDSKRRDLANLSQILAISVCKTLEEFNLRPTLKWPNDILISQKKIGGILTELTSENGHLLAIMGLGCNVNMPQEHLEKIGRAATSIFEETGQILDIEKVLSILQSHFIPDLKFFLKEGFAPFLNDFQKRMPLCGTPLQFRDSDGVWKGTFHSLNPDGSLNLCLEDGTVKRFYTGSS